MHDHTLPRSGAWVIVTKSPATEFTVPAMSIWYAMPSKLFPYGYFTDPFAMCVDKKGRPYSETDLGVLYRYRSSKNGMLPGEIELAERMDNEGVALDQRISIITENGELWIEPYEWVPAKSIDVFIRAVDGEHVKFHELGGLKKASRMREQMFYMQSRGISRGEALLMLSGQVKKPNVFWLEMHKAYGEFFAPRKTTRTIKDRMSVQLTSQATSARNRR